MIEPKILKGFRDTLPDTMIIKKNIIKKFESIFENYGFVPIDTPALEYTEILFGKAGGETDKQVYRFNDHGGRDVSLRFDLTVPLARYVSQNYNELSFPFKRYHIAPVWRGENTQKGRYREFYQCDFDIIGTKSIESDIEILLIIKNGLLSLNAGDFKILVNNRKILNALLNKMGLSDKSVLILRSIDKLFKIGYENVLKDLTDNAGVKPVDADKILSLLNFSSDKKSASFLSDNEIFNLIDKFKTELNNDQAVIETEYIFNTLKKMDILKYFSFNPAITRGLDYYTGIVFESFILDRINFGSICSGGRYDNLTALYSKNIIPGVGACFGLDRILALLEDKNIIDKKAGKTEILIFNLDEKFLPEYNIIAEEFRSNGINTEVFYEKSKFTNQFKLAEKKSIPFVLFAGEEEFKIKKYNLKNLKTSDEKKQITIDEIIKIIKQRD